MSLTRWLLALIVLLAGLVGTLHDHGPPVAEEAADAPSASLFALTPHAIIRDATHVAIVLERTSGAPTGWKAPTPGLLVTPEPHDAAARPLRTEPPVLASSLRSLLRGAVQARGPPAPSLTGFPVAAVT